MCLKQAQGIARDSNYTMESVLRDCLIMVLGMTVDSEAPTVSLNDFSDDQLWEIVNRRLPWAQDSRLRELTARSKLEELEDQEYKELEDLLAALDRQILLRSRALLLMKNRGHDIDAFLGL